MPIPMGTKMSNPLLMAVVNGAIKALVIAKASALNTSYINKYTLTKPILKSQLTKNALTAL